MPFTLWVLPLWVADVEKKVEICYLEKRNTTTEENLKLPQINPKLNSSMEDTEKSIVDFENICCVVVCSSWWTPYVFAFKGLHRDRVCPLRSYSPSFRGIRKRNNTKIRRRGFVASIHESNSRLCLGLNLLRPYWEYTSLSKLYSKSRICMDKRAHLFFWNICKQIVTEALSRKSDVWIG